MALTLIRPAPLLPLAEMLAREAMPAGLTPQLVARVQTGNGRSWGFVDARGETLACAGLMPGADGALEAWFCCRPTLARELLDFVRLAQLTLELARHDASVTCRVAPGWRPGERLARLLGFRRGATPGLWTWSGAR